MLHVVRRCGKPNKVSGHLTGPPKLFGREELRTYSPRSLQLPDHVAFPFGKEKLSCAKDPEIQGDHLLG